MIYTIENKYLKVDINDLGAELYSVIGKKSNIEYLWQGDSTYWGSRAINLFPVCGRIYGGTYFYNNKEYEMMIHGFARKNVFDVLKKDDDKISFIFNANSETLKVYPFNFALQIDYSLQENKIDVKYIITNNDKKPMYFAVGGHPGFNVPFNKDEKFTDYYLEFESDSITQNIFSDTCFFTKKTKTINLQNKRYYLRHNMFDNDAIFLKMENGSVKLKCSEKQFVEVGFKNMVCLGLWHKPKVEAPYICIEPWHGVPSDDGKVDVLENKRNMLVLQSGKDKELGYYIKIKE